MKYIVFLLFSLLIMSHSTNVSVKWYTLQQALDLQKKAPKKIVVDVYTDWCGWCKRMDANTFSNAAVANYMNANFYPVKFNAEGNDTIIFKGQTFVNKAFGKPRGTHQFAPILVNGPLSYPCFVFLSEDSRGISKVYGYQETAKWMSWLRYINKNKYKSKTYEEYFETEEKE